MRWLLALIIIILFAMYFYGEPETPPIEKTFMREPVRTLNNAKGVEAEYLDATEQRQKRMEQQLEEQSGGG